MRKWAKEKSYSPGEAGLYYEAQRGNISLDDVMKKMLDIVDVMEDSIRQGLKNKRPGKLIKACSSNYLAAAKDGKLVYTGAMDTVIAWTMATLEVNSYYGMICDSMVNLVEVP